MLLAESQAWTLQDRAHRSQGNLCGLTLVQIPRLPHVASAL